MPSGRFLVRIDPVLHKNLQHEARARALSLNDLCQLRLELPSALEALPRETIHGIRAARSAAKDRLVGIILFGSWARGHQRDGSDIDLLIVLKPNATINRALYRDWSDAAEDVGDCEPHFVALPVDGSERISGLWAEVAMDGLVLFDPSQAITRYMVHVRRAITSGQLEPRKVHGHTYWVKKGVA